LEKIPTSEKPGIFNNDFLGTVMGATGGAARPIIPILKATGLLNQSGAPTELYAQFQTDAGRPAAALQALRNGFGEVFRRNQYAHRADEAALIDVIVAITGLPKKEGIVRYILATFQAFQDYAKQAREDAKNDEQGDAAPTYDTPPRPLNGTAAPLDDFSSPTISTWSCQRRRTLRCTTLYSRVSRRICSHE
jgi:hypothetical protein